MRKKYIDNLRIICILLLFPFHACMIYNCWGELFYITGHPSFWASLFVCLVYPWWMTLLFVLAGMSSKYALCRRTPREYTKERVKKLFIPFLAGVILVVPIQSYIADIFYNGYTGSYLQHYVIFFTRYTYLTGQDGGFTPGQLWFVLYLFVIAMLMLPVMNWYTKSNKKLPAEKFTIPKLLPMFIIITLCALIADIGGKSLGEFASCFALGYFILSEDEVQNRLEKNTPVLAVLFAGALLARFIMWQIGSGSGLWWELEQRMVTWFGILAILGLGKKFLDRDYRFTAYLSKAVFPLYFFHQSILVVIGFYSLKYISFVWLQWLVIVVLSFLLSLICYEIVKKFRLTCFLFGIKYQKLRRQ